MLDKKVDAIKFINKVLKTNFKEKEMEKYTSSFIDKIFQNREADIVYKTKNRNIFILIEHQTKIDYSMPYRILEYEVAIIKSAIDIEMIKNKKSKLPLIIPIVLYTGKKKWNANRYLEECQEKIDGMNIKFGNYNLVDINEFSEEELLEDDTLISKMMLIEKTKDTEDMIKILEKVIDNIKDEDKETLKRIIKMIIEKKIGQYKAKKLLDKIEGGNEEMLAVLEMIEKENQMYINRGRAQGKREEKKKILEIAKRLLQKDISKEEISEITGLKTKEIEKIMINKN